MYTVNWYIENEIILVHYKDVVTKDELRACFAEVKRLTDSSSRSLVHTISDVGDITDTVSPLEMLEVVRDLGPSPNFGWGITIREKSTLMKMGIAFGASVFKSRYRTFDTMEKAEKFLSEMDATLNWEKADRTIIPG